MDNKPDKRVALSLASAMVAEFESTGLNAATMLTAFGMAAGITLSRTHIDALSDSYKKSGATKPKSFILPDLTSEGVDFAIRAFSGGLTHPHQIQIFPVADKKDESSPSA